MIGCTINIAEFRCRAVSRATSSYNYVARKPSAFSVTTPDSPSKEHDMDLLQGAILQEDPTVYDIGIAREAQRQRQRHRTVFRPTSNQRKAKVLRFKEGVPVRMKVRAEEARGGEGWSNRPDGPYDLPPAA